MLLLSVLLPMLLQAPTSPTPAAPVKPRASTVAPSLSLLLLLVVVVTLLLLLLFGAATAAAAYQGVTGVASRGEVGDGLGESGGVFFVFAFFCVCFLCFLM